MQQVAQTAGHDSCRHVQLLELKGVAPLNCFGLSFLLCSAMAEELSPAEETNRLAADILFTCHILSDYIQGYEALVPQELQQNFQLAGDVASAAKRELEEVMEEPWWLMFWRPKP